MIPLKFNFSQIVDLDNDFRTTARGLPVVVQRVLSTRLREIRKELRTLIPRKTGRLQRSFGVSVRKSGQKVVGRLGLFMGRGKISASTAIAGNVLQHPGATPKKGQYLWIPISSNRNADGSPMTSARQLLDTGGFVATSRAGNKIAFRRMGDSVVPMFILKKFVRFHQQPVPFEAKVEAAAPEIAAEIPEVIRQVIEAKKKTIESVIGG